MISRTAQEMIMKAKEKLLKDETNRLLQWWKYENNSQPQAMVDLNNFARKWRKRGYEEQAVRDYKLYRNEWGSNLYVHSLEIGVVVEM